MRNTTLEMAAGGGGREIMEMQTEKEIQTPERAFESIKGMDDGLRSKTSVRMHYEAQVKVIQDQIGGLEAIRQGLGLSQRKICQLLMVDPSAWSRWTKGPGVGQAPPHIYRALQWYLTIQEKIPGLTPEYFIGRDRQAFNQQFIQRLETLEGQNLELNAQKQVLEAELKQLQHQVQANRVGFFMVVIGALIMAVTFYFKLKSYGS